MYGCYVEVVFHFVGIQRHNNYHTRLRAWVEELRSLPYDPS